MSKEDFNSVYRQTKNFIESLCLAECDTSIDQAIKKYEVKKETAQKLNATDFYLDETNISYSDKFNELTTYFDELAEWKSSYPNRFKLNEVNIVLDPYIKFYNNLKNHQTSIEQTNNSGDLQKMETLQKNIEAGLNNLQKLESLELRAKALESNIKDQKEAKNAN